MKRLFLLLFMTATALGQQYQQGQYPQAQGSQLNPLMQMLGNPQTTGALAQLLGVENNSQTKQVIDTLGQIGATWAQQQQQQQQYGQQYQQYGQAYPQQSYLPPAVNQTLNQSGYNWNNQVVAQPTYVVNPRNNIQYVDSNQSVRSRKTTRATATATAKHGGFQADDTPQQLQSSSASKALIRTTVRKAKLLPDNQQVAIVGYLKGSANTSNPNEYTFTDNADTIKVEIEDDIWRGQIVKPSTKIQIQGKIDVNPVNRTSEIEVYRLDIVK